MTLTTGEEATVRAFFRKDRREQFLRRAGSKKGRSGEMERLWQYELSDLQHARVVPSRDRVPETVYRLLRSKGAPEQCHVMGTSEFDDQDVDLLVALQQHLTGDSSGQDVILICVPGALAYFHTHEAYLDDFILDRLLPVS